MTHPREGQILGPDPGAPVVTTVKTVAAPTMKLKLPVHLASRESAATHDRLPSATVNGGDSSGKVPENTKPASNEAFQSQAGDSDAHADGTGPDIPAPKQGCSSLPQDTEAAEAQQPAAGTSKAMEGDTDAKDADIPAPKGEPAKGKASKAKKSKTTKSGAKGQASGADAASEKVPQTPEKATPDVEIDAPEGDIAVPASDNAGVPKTRKSPTGKAKPKKPRVDPMLAAMEQAKTCRVEEEDGGDQAFSNTTLVVSPVVAAMQWRQEILRYMAPGMHYCSPQSCLRMTYAAAVCLLVARPRAAPAARLSPAACLQ